MLDNNNVHHEKMTKKECRGFHFTPYTAVGVAEGFIEPSCPREILGAWQYISHKELWKGLQGWFGRTVYTLQRDNLIEK